MRYTLTVESGSLTDRLKNLQVDDPLAPANQSPEACARRLRLALQMSDDGVQLKRSQFRRENPHFTEAQLDACVRQWLQDTPPPGFVEGFFVSNPHRFD